MCVDTLHKDDDDDDDDDDDMLFLLLLTQTIAGKCRRIQCYGQRWSDWSSAVFPTGLVLSLNSARWN